MDKIHPLQIAFLDVGHGDTIVVSINENNVKRAIIIDCNDAIRTKNYILKNAIQIVDYILITHLHQDHYKGINMLIDLLIRSDVEIKNICWEKDKYLRTDKNQKNRYKMFTDKLCEYHINKGINYVSKRFDDNKYRRLDSGAIGQLQAKIIYPNSFIANYFDDKNVNNTSTVVYIEYGNFKVILPGDLEGEGWYMLRSYMPDLKCDILKMPHHGAFYESKDASLSTDEIIKITKPNFSIISTGKNEKYKHPNEQTIDILKTNKSEILCTEVTDMCTMDMNRIKKEILNELKIEESFFTEKRCPCLGDIIVEIDDKIKITPSEKNICRIKRIIDNPCCN